MTARDGCEDYCREQEKCWGCSIRCPAQCQWNAIPECGPEVSWEGKIEGDITHKPGICCQKNNNLA